MPLYKYKIIKPVIIVPAEAASVQTRGTGIAEGMEIRRISS